MLRRALHLILPHRCLKCEDVLDADPGLCGPCWAEIRFISPPQCHICGLPLDFDIGNHALCGQCAESPPEFDYCRSVMVYDDASRDIILKFKHGDSTHGAPRYGQWMARVAGEFLKNADMLIPVPIHWTRLFTRTYNQSHLIAAEIKKSHPHLDYQPTLLKRNKRTKSQGHLTKIQRIDNVNGSFEVLSPSKVKGKNILLIDDVLTSGATLNACAKTLKNAGAKQVVALTLARVVRV